MLCFIVIAGTLCLHSTLQATTKCPKAHRTEHILVAIQSTWADYGQPSQEFAFGVLLLLVENIVFLLLLLHVLTSVVTDCRNQIFAISNYLHLHSRYSDGQNFMTYILKLIVLRGMVGEITSELAPGNL